VTYAYDGVGNRASLGYPDGKVVNYSYDQANRLSAVTDWLGRITNYSYDPASNLTRTAYPNGTTATFTYDPANRLTNIVNALKNLLPVKLGYTLDAVGNRTSFSVDGIATQYGYDDLNELTSAKLGPIKSTWTYDPVGNRTSETLLPFSQISSTYDADNRLLTDGKTTFAYDADGNEILKQPVLGPVTTYAFDAANRLVSSAVGSRVSSFDYDGDGNRISQSVGAGAYSYLNDVATALPVVLEESGPDGNIAYAYGLRLISESSTHFDYFYHYDGLGSVISLSDDWGRPSAAYLYDAWGDALLAIPDRVGTRNKFRFSGEALDPGTGLYFMRARYLDSTVGRMLGRDLLAGSLSIPTTENRYAYALNNPIRFRDPTGLVPDGEKRVFSSQMLSANIATAVGDNWTEIAKTLWGSLVDFAETAVRATIEGGNGPAEPSAGGALFSAELGATEAVVTAAPAVVHLSQQQMQAIERNYSIVTEPSLSVPEAILFIKGQTNYLSGLSDEKIKALLIQTAEKNGLTPAAQWLQ